MERDRIVALIIAWRLQSEYSWSINDSGAALAWEAAADQLEEELER